MNDMAGTSTRRKVDLSDVLNERVVARTNTVKKETASTQDSKFANISANPYFSVMFSEATPETKKSELVNLRLADKTKEETRELAKQYETFKEFLQEQRELMSREIIKLTDTETFAELQKTYQDINDALIGFEEDMKPLTDIIDAVYELRTSGQTLEAFKEIKADREFEEQLGSRRIAAQNELTNAKLRVDNISKQIAELSTQKKFFGMFGGIPEDAQVQIARLEVDLDNAIRNVSVAETNKNSLEAEASSRTSGLGENSEAKAKLREMLDLKSGEHTERQKMLVDSAINFIETSKTRIGSIREHLGSMDTQIENLSDTNQQMSSIYAILTEAEKEATVKNRELRDALIPETEEEDLISKMNRETRQREIDEHIKSVAASAVDTQSTYADLASGAIRILTMKDANQNQITKAREMHSRGVAGIADRLSTVLQAVSGAAIGEAQAMAQNTHRHMMDSTNRIAQKESIKVAMGINDTNDELQRVMEDLASYGEVSRASTDIIRAGLGEMQENLAKIAEVRNEVEQGLKDAIAVTTEVSGGAALTSTRHDGKIVVKNAGAPNPFKLGKQA